MIKQINNTMEINGKVAGIIAPQKFNEKTKYGFVIRFMNGNYEKKVAFDVWGDERWQAMGVQEGNDVSVSFDVESREWNGKYYTSCIAWKVVTTSQQTQTAAPQPALHEQRHAPQPVGPRNADDGDGLPF